jgi:hypothetical protein
MRCRVCGCRLDSGDASEEQVCDVCGFRQPLSQGVASEVPLRARALGAIPWTVGALAFALATTSYLLAFSSLSGFWQVLLRHQWCLPTGLLALACLEILVYLASRARPTFWVVQLRRSIVATTVPAIPLWLVNVTSAAWAQSSRQICLAMALQLLFASAGMSLMVNGWVRSLLARW